MITSPAAPQPAKAAPTAPGAVRLLAFYLPQYHPIPENDAWWGPGFTEWRNVTQARPLFRGHYQPRLPGELGFYDLRVAETRQAQAELARAHGVLGFCYYHYWFNGRRLLERPFQAVLDSGQPDFPFCLCWANEAWTRTWDGRSRDVLVEQVYSADDDRKHLHWLARAFDDPRYIRIDGRPLFLVYRAGRLPDPARTTRVWRETARALGLGELYLARVESFDDEHDDPRPLGFDAAVEFQPDWTRLPPPQQRGRWWRWLRRLRLASPAYVENRVFDYAALMQAALAKPAAPYPLFPCVMPHWDNSARRKTDAVIFTGDTPALYEQWLRAAAARAPATASGERLVFVNAWNEWGEGCYLEPDQRYGRAYLEATRRALAGSPVELRTQ